MIATRVSLRKKACANNKETLYLDYYPPFINPDTQKPQRWEFLGIRIHSIDKTETIRYRDDKGRSQIKIVPLFHDKKRDKDGKLVRLRNNLSQVQKNHNRAQMAFAEDIRLQRQIAVNKGNFQFASKRKYTTDFMELFKMQADEKNISNRSVWKSAHKKLEEFAGKKIMANRIDRMFAESYYKYLDVNDKLKQNTKASYFSKFKLAVKQAEKIKILDEGTFDTMVDLVMEDEEVSIEFLTLDELTLVKNTPCSNELYKKAALFSACTGLRRSDIVKFSWGQIKNSNEGLYIDMRQQKTAGVESIGLNDLALEILGDRQDPEIKPFGRLTYVAWATQDKELHQWIKDAGITKKITFHCFRHTFACALLHKGVDIFRVKELLGHKSVLTTQRTYAKVLTSDKKKAIDTIQF